VHGCYQMLVFVPVLHRCQFFEEPAGDRAADFGAEELECDDIGEGWRVGSRGGEDDKAVAAGAEAR